MSGSWRPLRRDAPAAPTVSRRCNALASGLPMVSVAGQTHATGSGPIEQYDHATSELLWWTPNGSSILGDGGGTVTIPFSGMGHGFFPTGQTYNDS